MAKETLIDTKVQEGALKGTTLESGKMQEGAVPLQGAEKGKKTKKTLSESMYSVSELVANAKKTFGLRQECVAAALKAAEKTECTLAEAKEIVRGFLKREVL